MSRFRITVDADQTVTVTDDGIAAGRFRSLEQAEQWLRSLTSANQRRAVSLQEEAQDAFDLAQDAFEAANACALLAKER